MNDSRRKKSSFVGQPIRVKLGLLYALFPMTWGSANCCCVARGASAMQSRAVAVGIVFAAVALADSRRYIAGRSVDVKGEWDSTG